MKFVMTMIAALLLVPAFAQARTLKLKPHRIATGTKNLELWCGAQGVEKARFPYLAAIHNYRGRHGGRVQIATVYKKGRVVARQYVYRSNRGKQLVYESSGDAFALSIPAQNRAYSTGEFKAVIRDEDGDKLIGNGTISCYNYHRS